MTEIEGLIERLEARRRQATDDHDAQENPYAQGFTRGAAFAFGVAAALLRTLETSNV